MDVSKSGTLLRHPISNENLELAAMLLRLGADPNQVAHRKTPLEAVFNRIFRGYLHNDEKIGKQAIKAKNLLIRAGAKIPHTLLHSACGYKQDVIQDLIEAGADIRAVDKNGNTPLHLAVNLLHEADKGENIELLIKNGVPLESKNKDGKTPLDCANKPEIKKLLIDAIEQRKSVIRLLNETNLSIAPGDDDQNKTELYKGVFSHIMTKITKHLDTKSLQNLFQSSLKKPNPKEGSSKNKVHENIGTELKGVSIDRNNSQDKGKS
ncbi:ankyrin repeat domain-containing protein [Wolbachia endosymbiont of Pentidionis agamae]|uniref:ankyrin repeat domain-containing protein n=1 Tax=Wolbachia endosymbiont of Pentidionis agamae TaxID=3110435 RepID=UPI002FD42DC0